MSVGDDLKNGKVFQDRVHHVLLWKVLQLVNEVDHVGTHLTPVQTVDVMAIDERDVFNCLNLFDNLLPK